MIVWSPGSRFDNPVLRDNLTAVPIAVIQIESAEAELGEIDGSRVEQRRRYLELVHCRYSSVVSKK